MNLALDEILNHYGVTVFNATPVTDRSWRIQTPSGPLALFACASSHHLAASLSGHRHLRQAGFPNLSTLLGTVDGQLHLRIGSLSFALVTGFVTWPLELDSRRALTVGHFVARLHLAGRYAPAPKNTRAFDLHEFYRGVPRRWRDIIAKAASSLRELPKSQFVEPFRRAYQTALAVDRETEHSIAHALYLHNSQKEQTLRCRLRHGSVGSGSHKQLMLVEPHRLLPGPLIHDLIDVLDDVGRWNFTFGKNFLSAYEQLRPLRHWERDAFTSYMRFPWELQLTPKTDSPQKDWYQAWQCIQELGRARRRLLKDWSRLVWRFPPPMDHGSP